MSERRRILIMMLIMITACLGTAALIIVVLYGAELNETRNRLSVTVQSQARLIESVARYDLADDEEPVRAVTRKHLERLGFEVITAADGREAIELFRKHSEEIVCVLLDMTMPHVDGNEAFREIRRIREDARVILSSGYNEQDATQHFVGKGLAGFLQKPYRSADLRERLIEVLS